MKPTFIQRTKENHFEPYLTLNLRKNPWKQQLSIRDKHFEYIITTACGKKLDTETFKICSEIP